MLLSAERYIRFYTLILLLLLTGAASALADPSISGLGNLNFGTWGGSLDMTAQATACVYRPEGDGTRNYGISSSSNEGSYVMTSGANTLSYSVDFNGENIPYSSSPVSFTNANTVTSDCTSGPVQTVTLTVTAASLGNAKAGLYEGTLVLIIQP